MENAKEMQYEYFSQVVKIKNILYSSKFQNKITFSIDFHTISYTVFTQFHEWLTQDIEIILYGKCHCTKKIIFAESCIPVLNKNLDSFCVFLKAAKIPKLTEKKIDILKNQLQEELMTVFFSQKLTILSEYLSLNKTEIETIEQKWQEIKKYSELHLALYNKGLTAKSVRKLYKTYGENSLHIIAKNPYNIMEQIGFGFKTADKIAQEYGIKKTSSIRIEASILFIIQENEEQGSTVILKSELYEKAKILLNENLHESCFTENLSSLLFQKKITIIDDIHISSHTLFTYESYCFTFLQKEQENKSINFNVAQNSNTEEQIKAIIGALEHKYSGITGPAGSGKTTIIKNISDYLTEKKKKVLILSPTGRAAQRIKELYPDLLVMTIHKCLSIQYVENIIKGRPIEDEDALPYDHLIIDESSMIDSYLFYAIVKKVSKNTALTFIGDSNQLSPVGPGCIFEILLSTNHIPIFHLNTIHRQKNNQLLSIASDISQGAIPRLSTHQNNYCYFIPIEKNLLHEKITFFIEKYFDQETKRVNIQIISFLHRGITGIDKINILIQQVVQKIRKNIDQIKILRSFYQFDKVIVIKNNYELGVFNGEIGLIIDGSLEYAIVEFPDKTVTFKKEYSHILELGYVISVHKSQGSEFSAVMIILFMDQYLLLNRKSLYTALTRTKKEVIIIGEKKALYCSIKNNKTINKNTLFQLLCKKKNFNHT